MGSALNEGRSIDGSRPGELLPIPEKAALLQVCDRKLFKNVEAFKNRGAGEHYPPDLMATLPVDSEKKLCAMIKGAALAMNGGALLKEHFSGKFYRPIIVERINLVRQHVIKPFEQHHFERWLPLWTGYLTFYGTDIADDVTKSTWQRFLDPSEPLHGLGAFLGQDLIGLVHFNFHRSTWAMSHYCYLEDLFVTEVARGRRVGRDLIGAVHARALEAGAKRLYWHTQTTNEKARALYDQVADLADFVQYRKSLAS